MTSQYLLPDLRRDEGLRLHAYPDPLSGGAPWTIGYGHTGPEVHAGLVWTVDQAEAALQRDVGAAEAALDRHLPWWRTQLADERQDVLVNMTFNMGINGLLGFHNTLALIQAGNYKAASDNMLVSAWARQVGARARRLAQQMRTGVHAPAPGSSAENVVAAVAVAAQVAPPPGWQPIDPPLAAEPADAAPEPQEPAPEPADPAAEPFDLPGRARSLWTAYGHRALAWSGGFVAAAATFLHNHLIAVLLFGLLALLIVGVVVLWTQRREAHHRAELKAALAAAPPGSPPAAVSVLSDADVARIAAALQRQISPTATPSAG